MQRYIAAQRQRRAGIESREAGGLEMRQGLVGPSSRRCQAEPQSGAPIPRFARLAPEVDVIVQIAPQRIEARHRLAHAVADFLIAALVGEGSEQAIPDDEDAAVIAVDAVIILAVVDA